jgi:hypothetical protein
MNGNVELDRGGNNIPGAFVIKSSHYIISGFALAAAIAWNTSIREAIKQKFPFPEDNIKANIISAVIVTLLLVFIIYIFPNTKTELPDSTRQKVADAEERNMLRKKVAEQEKKLRDLQNEMRYMQPYAYSNGTQNVYTWK